jgi:hypothetical protein
MQVPVLCPVCGAYWKCGHQPATEREVLTAEPSPATEAQVKSSVPTASEPVRGIITIDGVLLEDP